MSEKKSIDRRTFIKLTTASMATASVVGAANVFASGKVAQKPSGKLKEKVMESKFSQSDDLTWMPAWQIRELIGKREVSPVEVTEHFLERIESLDPKLHAFATVDIKGARAQAKQAEKAVSSGEKLGPLHGIPVSVKEHIGIKGLPMFDMNTLQHIDAAPRDELQVKRLRAAGAIIFGTNTEMGSGGSPPTDPKRTFNWDVEARSAWDLSRVPGWSSSGSASATVARLVPIAIGSDGGGSTRLPAAYSGVVGIAATPGRIPWIHPDAPAIALTASTGPMCRHVRDAAIATQALSGPDGRDFFSLQEDPPDFLATIDAGVKGMRFAWTDDFGFASIYALKESPRVIDAVRKAAQGFISLGATVDSVGEVWEDFFQGFIMTGRMFGSGGHGAGKKPTPEEYLSAVEIRGRNYDRCMRLFRDHDVILSPTSQLLARKVKDWNAAWTSDGAKYTHGTFAGTYVSHVMMFNWLSMPAFSVPCGFVDGLPVGLQIIGRPGSEALMFRIANAFQSAFPRDERPGLLYK